MGHSHKSAVAEHVHEVSPHMRSTAKALKSSTEQSKGWKEKIREAFSIQKRKPAMNRD